MKTFFAGTALALLIGTTSVGAAFALNSSEPLVTDRVIQQRIDTEEVTLPPPPDGPATPVPFCSPAAPLCP